MTRELRAGSLGRTLAACVTGTNSQSGSPMSIVVTEDEYAAGAGLGAGRCAVYTVGRALIAAGVAPPRKLAELAIRSNKLMCINLMCPAARPDAQQRRVAGGQRARATSLGFSQPARGVAFRPRPAAYDLQLTMKSTSPSRQ
jgi:hypothetical protein